MGIVVRFPRRHTRASSTSRGGAGRATAEGQTASSGQRSENQRITSSYFRAVKVLASSSKRSKKRQSPAASLPIVAKLTERDSAYADAQAIKLDRSSDSIASEDSRKIPTMQAFSVGNFLLAHTPIKSDKSAMAAVDQIRRTIRAALANAGETAIGVAKSLEIERNYIRDFLEEKKASLKIDVAISLSERFGIPLKELVPTKDKLPAIRKGARPHLYLSEHMEARGFDDQVMANRMDGITAEAVAKWRSNPSKMENWQVSATIHALGLEDEAALSRPPASPARPQRPPQPRQKASRKRA